MTLVSWCHHDSYVYRLGHCHVGRRRPSCAVYTILAHFGSESCCRLRKTEFFSKLWHFVLIAGFKSFSFARFSMFLGISFPKPFPFCRKTVVYIILAGTKKTNVSAAAGKLPMFDISFQALFFRFIVFSKSLKCNSWFTYLKFPCCNEWPVDRSDGSAHSWKAWKVPLAPAASTFFIKYACGTSGVRIFSFDLGISETWACWLSLSLSKHDKCDKCDLRDLRSTLSATSATRIVRRLSVTEMIHPILFCTRLNNDASQREVS